MVRVAEAQVSAIPSLPGQRKWADGVALRLRTRSDSQTSDSAFVAITIHWAARLEGGSGISSEVRGGYLLLAIGLSTPVGKLDRGHPGFGTVFGNLRVNPEWHRKVQRWLADYFRPRKSSPVGPIGGTDSGSVTDKMFESWMKREGMRDKGQASSIDSIWEVSRYRTSSGTVALPQDYRSAWELKDGSLVLTNDANFNPIQTFSQFGKPLPRVDPH